MRSTLGGLAAVAALSAVLPRPLLAQVGTGTDLPPPVVLPDPALGAPRRGALGWWTDANITARATATNNANFGASDDREPDLVLELRPALSFNREGSRLRVNGFVAADLIAYLDGTQTNRVLPQANVLANFEAVDNLFYIDASLVANQALENAFLPRAEFASTNNQYTYAQARLAPYLQGQVGQNVSWLVRSDNTYTWTTQSDNPLGNAYYAKHLAQIVRNPTPLGATVQASRDTTQIRDSLQPDQTLDTGLLILNYALSSQFTAGLRGGYETTTYTAETTSGPIYGANLTWRPSPLTSIDGYWESRFYGPSYQLAASHRHYRLAATLNAYRTVSTYPQLLLQIPSTGNVPALLDAILIARFPDPLVRQQQVQELIQRQALPSALPGGAYVYNQSANVLTGSNLNLALVGVRNTLALNVYYLKTAQLPDARVPPSFLLSNNSEQLGAGLTLSHRMGPTLTLNGTISGFQTEGFGPSEGLETRQGLVSMQVNHRMSLRNTFFVGTRYEYQRQRGALTPFDNSSAASLFAGLFHEL